MIILGSGGSWTELGPSIFIQFLVNFFLQNNPLMKLSPLWEVLDLTMLVDNNMPSTQDLRWGGGYGSIFSHI